MASGQGFVRERHKPSGTVYLACIKMVDPLTGKEHETSKQFKTRREAERHAAQLSAELRAGELVVRSPKTVADLLCYWDETYVAHQVRPSTALRYRHTLTSHLIPGLGAIKVQDLSASQVERFYAAKLTAGTGARTMVFCHQRLRQALDMAVRLGWVGRNVLERVTPPRYERTHRQPWDHADVQRFLAAATESGYGPIWLLLALTGMRRGEALGLRWSDVDLEGGVLVVSQAYVSLDTIMGVSLPKTEAGRRAIPLHPALMDALRSHRARQNERRLIAGPQWQDNDLVFASEVGTAINAGNLHRHFKRITASADVPDMNIHGLRHGVASHLLAAGEDIKTISDLLGHSRTSVTLDVYAHVIKGRKKEAIDTLGQLVLGASNEDGTSGMGQFRDRGAESASRGSREGGS